MENQAVDESSSEAAGTVVVPARREPGAWWRAVFPPARWLRSYQPRWLAGDAVAGATLAAYAIPVSLAYASLAGLPPQHGVYCCLFGGLLYALFGSSRQLAVGPTSAISMLVGATVAGMAGGDPARWASIAALTALVFAAICVLAWLLSLSSLVNFISETVLLGFKAGAAITIATTQLPKLLGVPGGGEGFFERVVIIVRQLGQTNLAVLAFGLAAIALLVAGEKLFPGRPVALVVVALSIVLVSVLPLAEIGFSTVGLLPSGLPVIELPELRVRDVDGVVPLAFACFLLAYIEGISAARALAQKNGYEINPRQELLALGAANLAAGLGQGYPVAGGLSQSSVNDKAGARTPLALVFASAVIALCLLYLTGLLRNLPNVVLAAIVLVAVAGLIKVRDLRRLWRVRRAEFAIAMVALVGVLLLGILRGVIVAAVMSLAMLLRDLARPHVAELGRIPGTRRYSDLERHPDNERVPGLLIIRVEAPLLYFNANHIRDMVRRHLGAAPAPVRAVVVDLSTSPTMDVTAAVMLGGLHQELAARGIPLRFANARASVRDFVRAGGGEAMIGELNRKLSLDGIIQEVLAGMPASGP
ncbi:MAG TPA: SulP family inorganic anion transporter [Thermoanaerobaculales bacterium]|nr:SulP family inorganic anion transporter [Thermoanaerobaculales bacterium]